MNMMKNVAPRKDAMTKQGYYNPVFPEKYGSEDKRIIYRSSLEFKFCKTCDESPKIIKWVSEPFFIPYEHPFKKFPNGKRKICRYYPDYYLEMKLKSGQIYKIVVEVKPLGMLQKPSQPSKYASQNQLRNYNRKLQTVIINLAKYQAAKKWCVTKGIDQYMFVTEAFFESLR